MKTALTILLPMVGFSLTAGAEQNAQEKPDPKTIVAAYLKSVGGAEAQRKITTRKMEGTMTLAGVGEGKITILQKAPGKVHTRIDLGPLGLVEEGTDGKVAWKKEPGQAPRKLEGAELQAKLRDARFFGTLDLLEQDDLVHQGEKEIDGTTYDVLKGTLGEDSPWAGTKYLFYFNRETAALDQMAIPMAGLEGGNPVSVKLSNPKEVDGISYPATMAFSINGQAFMTMTFDKITHGVAAADELFAMPAE